MATSHAWMISLAVIAIGCLLFYIAMRFAELCFRKNVSTKSLFKDFRQKMWMTIGLGLIFLGVYLVCAYLMTFAASKEARLSFFFLVYQHPVAFVYLGLLIFALFSTIVYLARMLIKYLYNSRR